jgi:hypothetical protein
MEPFEFFGHFIGAHPYITLGLIIAYWFMSNVVSALPSPDQTSGNGYKFIFTLAHGLAGSLPRLFPKLRLPGDGSRATEMFFRTPEQFDQKNTENSVRTS